MDQLSPPVPSSGDPVSVAADLVRDNQDNPLAVVMKVVVLQNWHIYAYVPEDAPYHQTKLLLDMPKGISGSGPWQEPDAQNAKGEPGIFVYDGELAFIRMLKGEVQQKGQFTVGLRYQACDPNQCLPPTEKKITL